MADPKKVSDLRPAEYNPRKITDEQLKRLKRSMDEYGDLSGIVFNRRSGNVIGGHQRIKKFDPEWVIDKIPVTDKTGTVALGRIKTPEGEWGYREVDWDEKKEQGANIAANKHGGDWDIPKLKDLLVGLDDGDFDLTLTGFDEAELKKMIDWEGKEGETDDDAVPEPPGKPKTKTGDLILLGNHRLFCGDCTDSKAVDNLMDGCMADLIVTSPPYNAGIKYTKHKDTLKENEYMSLIKQSIENCVRVLNNGRLFSWNVGVTPKSFHFNHAIEIIKSGLEFYRQIVWVKVGVAFPLWQNTTKVRRFMPNYGHEVIFLFSKGDPEEGNLLEGDEEYSMDVWKIHQSQATNNLEVKTAGRAKKTKSHGSHKLAVHPAVYPVKIPMGLIYHLTNKGEHVYDPFMGSGTTMIACEKLNRRCFGMEIDEAYCDVIVRRWEEFTGEKAERVRGK